MQHQTLQKKTSEEMLVPAFTEALLKKQIEYCGLFGAYQEGYDSFTVS